MFVAFFTISVKFPCKYTFLICPDQVIQAAGDVGRNLLRVVRKLQNNYSFFVTLTVQDSFGRYTTKSADEEPVMNN
jgi:hypothetical protein